MSLKENLKHISDIVFYENHDLTSFTTMRLSSRGDLVEVKSVKALQKLLPLLNENKKNYLIVGWGANQILPAKCDDLVIHLDFPFDQNEISELKDEYTLPASLGLNHLTALAVKFGLKGWEVFTGIPASLGGAIFMNAGTNLGEIGNLVKNVEIVSAQGELRIETINQKSFSYRHNHFVRPGDVIVGATLVHHGTDEAISIRIKEYLEYRKRTQPLATRNCGCVFKNPYKEFQAGRLIDLMGLKGLSVGGLRISTKHANFIENSGSSSWDQFESLVNIIKSNMDHFYGIEFELEVKIPYH